MGTSAGESRLPTHAEYIAAADRVLRLELSSVPQTAVSQAALGWMRAAMLYGREVARSRELGTEMAMAPIRRSLFELLMRLQWLHQVKDRSQAVRGMIAREKELAESNSKHLIELGVNALAELDDLRAIDTSDLTDGALKQQARAIVTAAKAANAGGLYTGWYHETQKTHATIDLAISMAPQRDGRVTTGTPWFPEMSNIFELLLVAITLAVRILLDEGAEQAVVDELFDAFLPLQLDLRD